MNIQEIELEKLVPAAYNPRKITDKEFKGLCESIKAFGQTENFIVNKDMTIISGHQRFSAMRYLGKKTAFCNVLDLDKNQEKKLNVVMNSPAISGKWDSDKLTEILIELKDEEDFGKLRLDELKTLDIGIDGSAEVPFTSELLEENNYVVLVFDKSFDWKVAEAHFGIETVKSLDSKVGYERKGIGRVIDGAMYFKKIGKDEDVA